MPNYFFSKKNGRPKVRTKLVKDFVNRWVDLCDDELKNLGYGSMVKNSKSSIPKRIK